MAIKRNITDLSDLKRGSTDILFVYRGDNLIWKRYDPSKFMIKVNSGSDSQFTIPTSGGGYNYDLITSDGQSFIGLTGDQLINFPSANTDYILEVSGDFPRWYQNGNSERTKVLDIIQWGDIKWSSFERSFRGCSNLTSSATDKPDLSNVTNMTSMFSGSSFNVDISDWDVSNVTSMYEMFYNTPFNQDIGGWDVSNVTDMSTMFFNTPFNQDIGGWDVSNVTDMGYMFVNSQLNQDIGGWDVSNVTSMVAMFQNSQFNQNISGWDVSNVTNMSFMFRNSPFNQDISGWNVSNVTNWSYFRLGSPLTAVNTPPKFVGYSFDPSKFVIKVNSGADSQFTIPTLGGGYNYDLTTSDGQSFTGLTGDKLINFPSANTNYILEINGDFPRWHQNNNSERLKVKDIMQWGTIQWSSFGWSFNGCSNLISSAIDKPDLSNVTSMQTMFLGTTFNQDISDWDVSNVTNMVEMFMNSQFNQDISGWNTSNVTLMTHMFRGSIFNQDISGWNTSNVTRMDHMFRDSQFNQDISLWDVSSVTNMSYMFYGSPFNQDISGWNVDKVTSWGNFRTGSPLTDPNTPPKFL